MDQDATREQRAAAIHGSAAFQHVRSALCLNGVEDVAASAIIVPLLQKSTRGAPGARLSADEAAHLLSSPYLPDTTFSVVDIETTGGRPPQHRVTELAALKVRGGEVVDSYEALVNPRRNIPWSVVRLTGITEDMVADKPDLMEALPGFLDFIGGGVFVAHCANFDFHFLKYYAEEYLERDFSPEVLCTFKLASQLLPEQKRFNLGELGAALGLADWEEGRHRALGDARATADILVRLTRMCQLLGLDSLASLLALQESARTPPPPMAKGMRLSPAKIDALPSARGVYSLYDGEQRLVFAGKANDVRRAVRDMFYPKNRAASRFARKLKEVCRVESRSLRSELSMHVEAFRAMRKSRLMNGNFAVAGAGFLRLAPTGARPGVSLVFRLAPDGARYYGPFRKKAQLADLLGAICVVFPLPGEMPEGYQDAGRRGGVSGGRQLPQLPNAECAQLLRILGSILEGCSQKDGGEDAFPLLRKAWRGSGPSEGKLRRHLARLHHLVRTYALSGPSVERRRLIIVEPEETRERRCCYFIRNGLLAGELSFVRRDPPVRALEAKIKEIFVEEDFRGPEANPESMEEAAVFASWMRRELMDGFTLNLMGRVSAARVMEAFLQALRDPQAAGKTITL